MRLQYAGGGRGGDKPGVQDNKSHASRLARSTGRRAHQPPAPSDASGSNLTLHSLDKLLGKLGSRKQFACADG